jgi:hypothetical protein
VGVPGARVAKAEIEVAAPALSPVIVNGELPRLALFDLGQVVRELLRWDSSGELGHVEILTVTER